MMSSLIHDLKFSFRMLVKSPLFTGIAIITLMLGIGLNAATYSTVNGLLLKPLGGTHEPERLIQLYRHWPGIEYGSNSIPHYQDLRDRGGDVFDNVGAWFFSQVSLQTADTSERVLGLVVSANFFQTYGAEPAAGRAFLPGVEDASPGSHAVTVLGHSFWQARFGGDESVLGTTIDINGRPFEVVGVAPKEFTGPISVADIPLYVPLMMQREIQPGSDLINARGSNSLTVVGRLSDGVTQQQASDAVDAIVAQLADEYPDSYEGQLGTTVVSQADAGIHPTFGSTQRSMSAVIMVVVGLLLLIACVNVANLFLARARERQREIGIRRSLGAGRWRIIRQLLTESLVFSSIAGILSLALAHYATKALSRVELPVDGPFAMDFGIDLRVLLFTAGLATLAGVVFGLAPGIRSTNIDLSVAMKAGGSLRRSRLSKVLVVAQMGLSLILLVSSGLFLRSLQNATQLDPGFGSPESLVMVSLDPGLQGYDEARARTFFDQLKETAEARPEIAAAGFTTAVPLGLSSSDRGVEIPGYEFAEGERQSLRYSMVSVGYFDAMSIDLLEGRVFGQADNADSQPVIIINQRFADRFWPQESALGKIVSTAGEDRQVVGVVETGKYSSLGEAPTEYMFLPHAELFRFGMTLVARTPRSADSALTSLRMSVANLDPDMPLFDVRTMEDHMGIALLPARLGGLVLGFFGILGLVLAAVGIYGVMAYSVSQRRRELGIRLAMGANRNTVIKLVLREGLMLAVIGSVLGLLGSLAAARLVENLLYNTSAFDPITFATVPLLLLLVAAAAVYVPARRASHTDPMQVLRME